MPSQEHVNWAKFRVAVVTATALLILGTLCVLLTGGTFLESKSTLYIFVPDATGIGPGSPVRVDGIGVGQVRRVELTGSNQPDRVVRVTLAVERARLSTISDDSTAQASSDNLIGDKFIDITSGTSSNHLGAGGEMHFKSSPELMKSVDLSQFQQPMRDIQALLDDIEKGQSPLGQFVMTDNMYGDVRKKIADLEHAAQDAASSTSAAGEALNTDTLYRQVIDPLQDLDRGLAQFQSGKGPGAGLLADTKEYDQMHARIADLRRSIGNLHEAEMLRSEASYRSWIRQVEALIQQVEAADANPLMTSPAVYDNLAGMAREWQGTVKELREDPRKFLRLKVF
jgi:phospholipid/cholesterol/gamma-HCH transport system substrate-binding protein